MPKRGIRPEVKVGFKNPVQELSQDSAQCIPGVFMSWIQTHDYRDEIQLS